jgi:hypothetical protein
MDSSSTRREEVQYRIGGDLIDVGVGIGIGIEDDDMSFGRERLDVYRAALEYGGWSYDSCTTGEKSMPIPIPIPRGEAEPKAAEFNL